MRLIEEIVSEGNLRAAIAAVKANKGAPGVDEMPVGDLDAWFGENWASLREDILGGRYSPQPVKRVYIRKPNGKQRPLGIPTVVDQIVKNLRNLYIKNRKITIFTKMLGMKYDELHKFVTTGG